MTPRHHSAWAKVRKRVISTAKRIGGEGLEYRANPLPILKGRLIALGLLLTLVAADNFVPALAKAPVLKSLALLVVAAIAWPWFIVQSLKFNAYNTAYRNIRLRFDSTYGACLKIVAAYWWLPLMPITYPYLKRRLVQFAAENTITARRSSRSSISRNPSTRIQ